MIIWFGLLVPKGTPQEIIDKLYAAQKRGFNEKRMPPVIEKIGMIPYLTTPQEVDRIIKEPHELYSRAAQEFGFEVK